MLDKGLRHCKDGAARPQSRDLGPGGERRVEPGQTVGRAGAIPSNHGLEWSVEFGIQAQPASDTAKLDDLDTDR